MNDQPTPSKKDQAPETAGPEAITNLDETDWLIMLMEMRIVGG